MRPLLCLLALAACAAPPEVPPSPGITATAPALVPLDPILAAAGPVIGSPETDLTARADALQSRAAALRAVQ